MVHQHGDHHNIPSHYLRKRPGAWLPADHRIHHEYIRRQTEHVQTHPAEPLTPALEAFKELIENNTRVYMYFRQMFEEIPKQPIYQMDVTGSAPAVRDYETLLQVLNRIVGKAPEWTDAEEAVGVVGVPMCALFDYPMGTPSGYAAFLDPDVNKALRRVLNEWGQFLQTPASAEVLKAGPGGWFGQTGLSDLMEVANKPLGTSHKFEDMYICDPSAKHYGFQSWDDFFTRKLQPDARPVASPDDDSVVVNACESKVFNISYKAQLRDRFYAKGQPYSLLDMLAHDPLTEQFADATVYQAFLSALSYHRWHAPVSGTIKRAFVQEGTYFSEPLFEGVGAPGNNKIDKRGIGLAQGYLSSLATRAVIFIEADNKDIGLMAGVFIGMDEVSTCDITVKEGQRVKKGDELGMFHFGGSSHCLVFRSGVELDDFPELGREENVPVRGKLAVAKAKAKA